VITRAALAAVLLAAAVCGCSGSTTGPLDEAAPTQASPAASVCSPKGSGFALSISSTARGESTPVLAAARFASYGYPAATGWREISRTDQTAYAQASNLRVEVVHAPRGGWIVDAGDCL
jgi:hypothetical protein